jgi:hypothetical protein
MRRRIHAGHDVGGPDANVPGIGQVSDEGTAAGARLDEPSQWRESTFYYLFDVIPQLVTSGEAQLMLDEGLNFDALPRSKRAFLAVEMVNAMRDRWRFRRCDYCQGWHRIRRARPDGRGYCSRRCVAAASRAEKREEA